MFLPPVADGTVWLNDPEGSQPRANVSFASIGAWYRAMVDAGFTVRASGMYGLRHAYLANPTPCALQDLSYFNVNEFGLNIVLPTPEELASTLSLSQAAGICADTWQNASACLAASLADALLTHSYSAISGSLSTKAIYSWQNAVVMDPGVPSYHAFLLEQV